MTIQNIKDFSMVFGASSALISNWTTLSEYKAGKIHLFYETLDRSKIVDNSLTFTRIVLGKLAYLRIVNQLQSKPINWAIHLIPIASGYLKSRTQKTYPLLAKSLSYLENCIEKSAYATFIVGSIALVRFGHLFTGYAVLSTLVFNQIISSGFAKSHLPLLKKVDSVFKKYFNPMLRLVAIATSGNYLTIGYSLFSLALITHASFTKPTYTIQKPQTDTQDSSSNRLTLEKWKEFNTKQDTFLTINRERIPKINFPSLNEVIDAKQYISNILDTLPENLQKNLIDRIKFLPGQIKQQYTFEDAKSIAISYLDKLIAFTKESSNPIWNTLLQQSCLILQQLNDKPNEQLSGIKELLFGSEGQCEVAQQKNILSGFLLLAQTKPNIDIELKFNLSLESLSSENFRYFLEAGFKRSFLILEKTKMGPFISPLKNCINLTDIHTYQTCEKFYGSHFGIHPIAEDLATESSNIAIMGSNPLLYISMRYLYKFATKNNSEIYFTTQLLKITSWLSNQIAFKQLFTSNDISAWFSHWITSLSISAEEKDLLSDELANYGTIAGHQVCDMNSSDIKPIALIAFLYGMDVFTDAKLTTDWQQEASIRELIENLETKFDAQVKDFKKTLDDLDVMDIKNPSLAKICLVDYLPFSGKSLQIEGMRRFMDSLSFSEQCNLSVEEQSQLKTSWKDKATKLKKKFDKLDFATGANLNKHLYNIIDLKNLNISSEILFISS